MFGVFIQGVIKPRWRQEFPEVEKSVVHFFLKLRGIFDLPKWMSPLPATVWLRTKTRQNVINNTWDYARCKFHACLPSGPSH